MRQQIGFLMQLAVLTLLPFLILWQLNYGMPLLWMPVLTLVGIGVFTLGTNLRGGQEGAASSSPWCLDCCCFLPRRSPLSPPSSLSRPARPHAEKSGWLVSTSGDPTGPTPFHC